MIKTNITREEVNEEMIKHPEKSVCMEQTDEGYFELKYALPLIPVPVVNAILKTLHNTYLECLPEDVLKDLRDLNHKCKVQRRWTIFWYGVAIAALGYIIVYGGR
jgi:hypothetical protein